MNLREARLCLDCEELHDDEQCPVCASEAFMFLTRWIPPQDGLRQLVATAAAPSDDDHTSYATARSR